MTSRSEGNRAFNWLRVIEGSENGFTSLAATYYLHINWQFFAIQQVLFGIRIPK